VLTVTMKIESLEFSHGKFFEDSDRVQMTYEQLRLASLDRRHSADSWLSHTVETHGVAGLFIDPGVLSPLIINPKEIGLQSEAALHYTEPIFKRKNLKLSPHHWQKALE